MSYYSSLLVSLISWNWAICWISVSSCSASCRCCFILLSIVWSLACDLFNSSRIAVISSINDCIPTLIPAGRGEADPWGKHLILAEQAWQILRKLQILPSHSWATMEQQDLWLPIDPTYQRQCLRQSAAAVVAELAIKGCRKLLLFRHTCIGLQIRRLLLGR